MGDEIARSAATRYVIAATLREHQPVHVPSEDGPIDHCSCGWRLWGGSFTEHQADHLMPIVGASALQLLTEATGGPS